MNNAPDFTFEINAKKNNVIGIDESGCGPWAGPVVAAAVMFFDYSIVDRWVGINDSKKLTRLKREEYFRKITSSYEEVTYGIGIVSVEEIDEAGIGAATKIAMERAVSELDTFAPKVALIDGIRAPNLPMPIQLIKKGDCLSISIAAASIIAKVTRDGIMRELDKQYPEYWWVKNSGYGTAQHIKALQEFGITEQHRKSFSPIQHFIRKSL